MKTEKDLIRQEIEQIAPGLTEKLSQWKATPPPLGHEAEFEEKIMTGIARQRQQQGGIGHRLIINMKRNWQPMVRVAAIAGLVISAYWISRNYNPTYDENFLADLKLEEMETYIDDHLYAFDDNLILRSIPEESINKLRSPYVFDEAVQEYLDEELIDLLEAEEIY
jgi:hypothetical protein